MKKLTTLLFSILISFNTFGEWTEITESTEDDTSYIDKDTIKERGGNVYFWVLVDFAKPDKDGEQSLKFLMQAECDLIRAKRESILGYKGPMGTGKYESYASSKWEYLAPGTTGADLVKYACNYVK